MKRFYVDAVEDGAILFLVGPFRDEVSARRREKEVAEFAVLSDHVSPFSSFGVSSIDGGYDAFGKLNRFFKFAEGKLMS